MRWSWDGVWNLGLNADQLPSLKANGKPSGVKECAVYVRTLVSRGKVFFGAFLFG